MENDNNKKMDLKSLLTADKTRIILIIVAVLCVLFIFLSGTQKKEDTEIDDFSTSDYQQVLSQNILDMVKSIKGAGEAKVLLTLENSYEYIYLDDGKTLQKINEPTIRGVVVACDGGESAGVQSAITELLTTVLNIPSTKVCVTKLI